MTCEEFQLYWEDFEAYLEAHPGMNRQMTNAKLRHDHYLSCASCREYEDREMERTEQELQQAIESGGH